MVPCSFTMTILVLMPPRGRAAFLTTEADMVRYMEEHPSRAYLSHLVRYGPYTSVMEVGVAGGRFAEHFLTTSGDTLKKYIMIEPFPNKALRSRYPEMQGFAPKYVRPRAHPPLRPNGRPGEDTTPWYIRGIGEGVEKLFFQKFSTDPEMIAMIPTNSVDLVYLDGAHDHDNVFNEMEPYWRMVAPGGVLAGRDYCNYGEPSLPCSGCASIPRCVRYTHVGKGNRTAKNQNGVVSAVQKWLLAHPELTVNYTRENFTREQLARDGMNYDLVITATYNPSWYIFKSH